MRSSAQDKLTAVGRVLFNASLPSPMPFVNGLLKKKGLQQVVQYCHLHFGLPKTVEMLAAHLGTLWLRDARTHLARPFSIPGPTIPGPRGAPRPRQEQCCQPSAGPTSPRPGPSD